MSDQRNETHGEPLEERGDPDYKAIFVVAAIGVISVVAIVVGLQAFYYAEERRHEEAKYVPPVALENYRAEQDALLTSYGWVSEADGVVQIPIDRAMELIVEEEGGS